MKTFSLRTVLMEEVPEESTGAPAPKLGRLASIILAERAAADLRELCVDRSAAAYSAMRQAEEAFEQSKVQVRKAEEQHLTAHNDFNWVSQHRRQTAEQIAGTVKNILLNVSGDMVGLGEQLMSDVEQLHLMMVQENYNEVLTEDAQWKASLPMSF